jgi:hypothetical protein
MKVSQIHKLENGIEKEALEILITLKEEMRRKDRQRDRETESV